MVGMLYGLLKPLYGHIQCLRELRNGLGGARTAPTFEVGIALADTFFETQMQLRFVAPVANGFQPTVPTKHCSAGLRREHNAAGS